MLLFLSVRLVKDLDSQEFRLLKRLYMRLALREGTQMTILKPILMNSSTESHPILRFKTLISAPHRLKSKLKPKLAYLNILVH